MAAENIGSLVPTKIPGYSDAADIQAALRLYHYGSYDYDPNETNANNLVNPSIAYVLNDLQNQVGNVSAISPTIVTAKGDLISATAASTPTRIGVGSNGQVLTANSATATGLSWTTISAISPSIVTAKGDLISASAASTPVRLPVGTNGQALIADSTTTSGLAWTSNIGKILQVVVNSSNTQVSQSSFGTHIDAVTATITPRSSSSSFVVLGDLAGISIEPGGTGGPAMSTQLARTVGGSVTRNFAGQGLALSLINTNPYQTLIGGQLSMSGIDSPNTTSPVTYSIRIAPSGSVGTTVYAQRFSSGESTITILEVAP